MIQVVETEGVLSESVGGIQGWFWCLSEDSRGIWVGFPGECGSVLQVVVLASAFSWRTCTVLGSFSTPGIFLVSGIVCSVTVELNWNSERAGAGGGVPCQSVDKCTSESGIPKNLLSKER